MYWYDPQTERGHFCDSCGCEFFESGEICSRCQWLNRLDESDMEI